MQNRLQLPSVASTEIANLVDILGIAISDPQNLISINSPFGLNPPFLPETTKRLEES